MNDTMSIPAKKLMANVTMRVKLIGMTAFRVRTWMAIRLVRLAARIVGCGVSVDLETDA